MKTSLFISIVYCLLILNACKDDTPTPPQPSACGMTIDQFPLKVGNWWEYEVSLSFRDTNGIFGENISKDTFRITCNSFRLLDSNDTIFALNDDYGYNFSITKHRHSLSFNGFSYLILGKRTKMDFPLNCDPSNNAFYLKNEIYPLKDTIYYIGGINHLSLLCFYPEIRILEHYQSKTKMIIVPNIGIVNANYKYYDQQVNTLLKREIKLIEYKIL